MAGGILDIKIPNLAESVTEGDIGSWLVENGAQVKKDQPILELETDKATVEIAAEASGVLEIVVQAGETVRVGDVVGRITEGGGAQAVKREAPPEGERADEAQSPADDVAPKKPVPQPARADAGGAEKPTGEEEARVESKKEVEAPPSPEIARAEPGTRRVKMTR
ncbi:MAG: dihydrolipoamide succinyltransferase, partial [Gemmatimonadetes bacterium]|nr:dihydrolipoamide succinyltransferase [Gemmatimonadota bacterium]